MKPAFVTKEALSFGWTQIKKNFWFLTLFTLISFVAQLVLGDEKGDVAWIVVTQVAAITANTFLMYVFTVFGLKALKGEAFSWGDLSDIDWRLFGVFFLASVLSAIIYVIGFVFLIIPGVIAAVRLNFFGFAVIEEGLSAVDSLKRSWAITKGRFWEIFFLGLVLGLVNVLGLIALGVGLLVTVPLTLVTTAYVYDRLKSASAVVLSEPQA